MHTDLSIHDSLFLSPLSLARLKLTIEGLVLSGEGVLQGPAGVSEQPLHLPAAQRGQFVLHAAGAAGVALGTDAQVLP